MAHKKNIAPFLRRQLTRHAKLGSDVREEMGRIILPALLCRASLMFLFSSVSILALSSCDARAACHLVGGVATCDSEGNDYPDGISYDSGVHTIHIESGTTIVRPAENSHHGIGLTTDNMPLTVILDEDVSIYTNARLSDGVHVVGDGDITITSAANINVSHSEPAANTGSPDSTAALYGSLKYGGTGNITITQAEHSLLDTTGDDAAGIFGVSEGIGDILLSSWGEITTNGERSYGINAWNNWSSVGNATTILEATGIITTSDEESVGVYSLNDGIGDAIAQVHGDITTTGLRADGAISYVSNDTSLGNATISISDTAGLTTMNDSAKGAWALNNGIGVASIASSGVVKTSGERSYGLMSDIGNANSEATASVNLTGLGTVSTTGALGHGIYARNLGSGTASAAMDGGTSITTTGNRAHGIIVDAKGAGSVVQASNSDISVTGAQAFGVNLNGATGAKGDIDGNVTARGEFGIGVAGTSSDETAEITIGASSVVTGGWQADVDTKGVNSDAASAGVQLIAKTSLLNNAGSISAGSDRAIVGLGEGVTVENTGLVSGFVELSADMAAVFNNNAGGLFDMRHFADSTGDDLRDFKRVSVSDFGDASNSVFNNQSGALVRLAQVEGSVTTDDAGYYTPTAGSFVLDGGFYDLSRADIVQAQFANLGSFNNAGTIDLRGAAIGNTLVIGGDGEAGGLYVSDGGQLLLNTVFNAGASEADPVGSLSDVLIVDGTELGSGETTIRIDRRDGAGAATPGNGILLVEVRDKTTSAADVFTLQGDYLAGGQQAIIKGAYSYTLNLNGIGADDADGNWYLRNAGVSPNVPVYEIYPEVLLPLVNVPTLQQRVGNRYWNEPVQRPVQTVFCKDASQNYQCEVTQEQASYYVGADGKVIIETNGIWGRIEGRHSHNEPALSTTGAQYDANLWTLQAGIDRLLAERESGKLIGGLTVHYGRSSTDITASVGKGDISSYGYGLGGTLTWYANNGFYADAQARATWLNSDLGSKTTGLKLGDGNKGFGYALSLEAGKRIAVNANWTVTPQAQLVYSNVRFDSFTDPFGATVSLSDGDSLRGRLGLAAEHQRSWKADNGTVSRLNGYGIVNLYNEFRKGTRVKVAGEDFARRNDRLWGALGVGGSYNWNDDKYSLYGEVSTHTSLKHFADSYDVGGTLGLRVRW